MKTVLLLAASTLLVAGCSTTPQFTKWEYQVVTAPPLPAAAYQSSRTNANTLEGLAEQHQKTAALSRGNQQTFLNELGKQGWILVNEDQGTFYLKRPLK